MENVGGNSKSEDDISKHLLSLSSIMSSLKSDIESLHTGMSGLRSDVAVQIDDLRKEVNTNFTSQIEDIHKLVQQQDQQMVLKTSPNIPFDVESSLERKVLSNPATKKKIGSIWDDENIKQSSEGGKAGVKAGSGEEKLDALVYGDIISMSLSEFGPVFGDILLNKLGVEHIEGSRIAGPTTNDSAFRIMPKLNYRFYMYIYDPLHVTISLPYI